MNVYYFFLLSGIVADCEIAVLAKVIKTGGVSNRLCSSHNVYVSSFFVSRTVPVKTKKKTPENFLRCLNILEWNVFILHSM